MLPPDPLLKLALLAAGLMLAVSPLQDARAETAGATSAAAPACDEEGLAMLASPVAPWRGAPLRVVFASDKPLAGELLLTGPDGKQAASSAEMEGGPPYFWTAEVESPKAGEWQATLRRSGASGDCASVTRKIAVATYQPQAPRAGRGSVWPIQDSWNRENENLYSAWIAELFDAPLEEELSWPALHVVLRDPKKNLLFNHLGLKEDQQGHTVQPDCADLPYFLRAYFAFKMGLPYGYAKCTRGGGGQPPKCPQWWNIAKEEPPPPPPTPQQQQPQMQGGGFFGAFGARPQPQRQPVPAVAKIPQRPQSLVPGFGFYIRMTIANGVHSGNGRTALDDDKSDFYPIALSEESLRPGTIYADPYGHVLILAKRVPQEGDGAGIFLAVDAQPDGTVARKRFWRGNFLFAQDAALGGPGFKRFRPIVREQDGSLRRLTNAEIEKGTDYADVSLEQSKLSVEGFYDRMDDVMSPAPIDPARALEDAINSLEEQVNGRVTSVENGRKYHNEGGSQVEMPDGPSIFETTGAWESYATPSRDLRLLIAIDVVRHFPERVARRAERYAIPAGQTPEQVKAALDAKLAGELEQRKFTYKRSDGSDWTLTLKDVFERAGALEMAYNINDCVELRWGAAEQSDEAATCKRIAPKDQRQKMAEEYRAWFRERTRPPRG